MSDSMMASLYSYGPIVLMVIIFYFLLYRPQKKQQKQRNTMMDNLKVGHRILTIGGIHGEITYIDLEKSDFIRIRIADNVEIKISSAAVARDLTQEKQMLTQLTNNKKFNVKNFQQKKSVNINPENEYSAVITKKIVELEEYKNSQICFYMLQCLMNFRQKN